jgi:hypothetical protein
MCAAIIRISTSQSTYSMQLIERLVLMTILPYIFELRKQDICTFKIFLSIYYVLYLKRKAVKDKTE